MDRSILLCRPGAAGGAIPSLLLLAADGPDVTELLLALLRQVLGIALDVIAE